MIAAMRSRTTALFGLALLLGGCDSARRTSLPEQSAPEEPPELGVTIDPQQCPASEESSAGKITHEAYVREHPDQAQAVTIQLRPIAWPNVACASAVASPDCPDRDAALRERQALNQKQVACVLAAFGQDAALQPRAEWYEPLATPSSGLPTPIGVEFSVTAVWSQLEPVARHPYVARITPAFGESVKLGIAPPPAPAECPAATDLPDAKLTDAASIQGQGRKPVVIELSPASLPPLGSCPTDGLCDELLVSGWQRSVASTRQVTCVRRLLDSKLQAAAPNVPYAAGDVVPLAPGVPPFGDRVRATLAFGLGLTWEEAYETAKHPFVQRIWTSNSLSFDTPPQGCPPDLTLPVATPTCSSQTEPIDGKLSASDETLWQSSTSPNEVLIAIRHEYEVCPAPDCTTRDPDNPCPELAAYLNRLDDEARASQICVRALIATIGGMASDEVFTLGDGFSATLTWPQIQTVAAQPDVISIVANVSTPPP